MPWKTGVEPVKWMPARCGLAMTGLPTSPPDPGMKLMTPGGKPAASISFIRCQPVKTVDDAGFHNTVLPIKAGAVGRLPAMEAKLKGVTAKTNPSSARYSTWSQCPSTDSGCCS
jgi:hypothetical protein